MKQHSYLSPKCHVQKSLRHGLGVFAKEKISRNEVIALWGGIIYSLEEITELAKKDPRFETHCMSIYKGFYIGPISITHWELDDTELFNHNCDPNAGVKGQIALVARRDIREGEEICFDYETTEITPTPFLCNCGSPTCRKKIEGGIWKDPGFRERNQGYLSWYIEDLIERENTAQQK